MSRYQSFRSARDFEKKARDCKERYQKMLREDDPQIPLYHYNQSIRILGDILMNLSSNAYEWKDSAADQLQVSLEKLRSGLNTDKNTYISAYQEGVESAEKARKAFAREMMDLVNSFNEGDWIECALGEIRDSAESGIARVKQLISSEIKRIL